MTVRVVLNTLSPLFMLISAMNMIQDTSERDGSYECYQSYLCVRVLGHRYTIQRRQGGKGRRSAPPHETSLQFAYECPL